MFTALKEFLKRHWPPLRLRTILFAVLLFVAVLPVAGALFLRVYENTLVRQTEAELVAQGAALTATAAARWPGATPQGAQQSSRDDPGYYRPEAPAIDLSSTPVLPERGGGSPAGPAASDALAAAARLAPILDETSRTTLASLVLVDRTGAVVRGQDLGISYRDLPEVQAALAGRPATVLRRNNDYRPRYRFEWLSRAADVRIHHTRPIVVGNQVVGALILSRSPRALFRGAYQDRGKFALGAAGLALTLMVLSVLVSRGVTRPVEALSRASREVAAGQGEIPETPPTAAVEIRQLYEDFRAMAEAIARRSAYLRDFAAAVSHEFKTPLASINGAVELLEDHIETMTAEERARFLANIRADSGRLSQLVTRLLDLARADMATPEAGLATDLGPPLTRIADAMAGSAFRVAVSLPPDLPAAAVPEAVIESVVTTLLENARQAGASQVDLVARRDSRQIRLDVTDDGPGIPSADQGRLFEPFFTTRRAEGGTGLGLPIARSLLAAHGGAIGVIASPAGARFEIVLPMA